MRLFNEVVATGCGDHLDVLRAAEHGKLAQSGTVTPELVGMDGLWDVVLAQQADEKGLGSLGVTVFLKEDVQHDPLFVHRPP